MSGWDNRPDGAARFQLEPTAQSFRPKSPQLQFSSGYGLRDQTQPRETGPLPPEEERIGPDGSRHRLYPAPSPIEPPINVNEGWSNTETSASHNVTKSIQNEIASIHKADDGGWDVHVPSTHNPRAPPPQRGGYGGDGGPTAYVQWESGADTAKVVASNQELEEQFARYRQESGGRADMFGMRQGPADNGYGNRGPAGALRGGYGSGQQDSGWGSRGESGNANNNQNDWGTNMGGYGRDPPPHRSGGGGGNSCHNCGREGHFSRECPDGAGPTCYRCHETGHMSSSCPKGGSGGCFNCGEEGHMSRECPSKGGGAGAGNCYNCGEVGHLSRDCPTKGSVRCYNCNQDGHISRDCPQGGGGGGGSRTCYKCGEEGHFSRECPSGGGDGGYGGGDGGYRGYGGGGYSRDTAGGNGYGAGTNNNGGGHGWDDDGVANKGDADGWGAAPPTSRDGSGWGANSAPNNTSNHRGGNEGGWGDAQSSNNFGPNTSNVGPNASAPSSNVSEPRGLQVHPDRLRQMDPQLASRSTQGTGNVGSFNPNNGGNAGNAGPRNFGPNSDQILRHPRGPPAEPRTPWDERRAAAPSNDFGGGQDSRFNAGHSDNQADYNGGQSNFNCTAHNSNNYSGSQAQPYDNQGDHQANQSGYSGNQGGAPPPAQKAQEDDEFGGW